MEELQKRYNGFNFKGFESMEQTITTAKQYVKKAQSGERIVFSTQWPRLDKQLMGGLQPGKMYTISGRPGSGKSQFSNQLLFNVLDQAEKDNREVVVFYFSMEMPGYQQLLRIVSGDLNTSVFDLIKPQTYDSRYEVILDKFKKYPVFFYNIPETMTFFKGKINQFCNSNPDKTLLVIADHTRLFKGDNKEERHRIADVTNTLMECQAKYNTISIILSQLNRNIESNERANTQYQPRLSDLFGDDTISQNSHVVIMLNRPLDLYGIQEPYCGESTKQLMAAHIEKNREGEIGMIPFNTHYPSFKLTERA